MQTANDPGAAREVLAPARVPLFCDTELAGRIERAEADLIARVLRGRPPPDGHRRVRDPDRGGMASFAEEGSPYNKVAGLGFGGVPDAAALDEIEQAFAGGVAPRRSSSPTSPIPRSASC